MARREGFIGPNRSARRYAIIAAVCKAVGVVLFYIALLMIPANRAVVISTISPVVSVVGIFLFYYRRWLVSKLEVTYISFFSHLGKAVSILYAVVLLGERISPLSLLCFILILAGTVVATKDRSQSESGSETVKNSFVPQEGAAP